MKDGEAPEAKRQKLERLGRPVSAQHIVNDWLVVILSSGIKFFHNVTTSESIWSAYGVDELQDAMDKLDKTDLLLQIARTRGLEKGDLPEELEGPSKSGGVTQWDGAHQSDEPPVRGDSNSGEVVEEFGQHEAQVPEMLLSEPQPPQGISLGYSSSEDDLSDSSGEEYEQDKGEKREKGEKGESEEDAGTQKDTPAESQKEQQENNHRGTLEESQKAQEETEINQGINLSDFSDLEDQSPETFKSLFLKYSLTPFDSWELVSERMVHDPEYLSIDTNQERKAIFDEWCKEQMVEQKEKEIVSDTARFVAFIKETQKSWKRKLYFAEFKRKYRSNSQFKSFKLSDKEKETIYKEAMAFDKEEDKHAFLVKKLVNSPGFANAVREASSQSAKEWDFPKHITQSVWMLWLTSPEEESIKTAALEEASKLLNV